MIYNLLKNIITNVIESPTENLYMTKDVAELQVEFFHDNNKIEDVEYDELKLMLNPVEVVTV